MTQSQPKKSVQKIILSSSRDIPFDKLMLSQSNVRYIKAGVSIEELAEDIARRTLLQSLMVRPVRDAEGIETGMYEIPAGGRRYRALALLVKQRRLAKTAPVPCVVREAGISAARSPRGSEPGRGDAPICAARGYSPAARTRTMMGALPIQAFPSRAAASCSLLRPAPPYSPSVRWRARR